MKKFLVIWCKTEERSQKWPQEEVAWGLLARLWLWQSRNRENLRQNVEWKSSVGRFTGQQKFQTNLFSSKHLLIVFFLIEKQQRGTPDASVQISGSQSQWRSNRKDGVRDNKHTLGVKERTGGLQQDLGRGQACTRVGSPGHGPENAAWEEVDKFSSQSTLVYLTLREV